MVDCGELATCFVVAKNVPLFSTLFSAHCGWKREYGMGALSLFDGVEAGG